MKITDGQIVDFTKDGIPFPASSILASTAETCDAPSQEALEPDEEVKRVVSAGNITPMYQSDFPMYTREEPKREVTRVVTTDNTKQDFLQHVTPISEQLQKKVEDLMKQDIDQLGRNSTTAFITSKIAARLEVLSDFEQTPEVYGQIKALEWVLKLLK